MFQKKTFLGLFIIAHSTAYFMQSQLHEQSQIMQLDTNNTDIKVYLV